MPRANRDHGSAEAKLKVPRVRRHIFLQYFAQRMGKGKTYASR